jgi:hypothetical protein
VMKSRYESRFFKNLAKKLLKEENSKADNMTRQKDQMSLDMQVDKYFIQFEKESKIKQESLSRRGIILFEAPEDEEEDAEEETDEEAPADDASAEEEAFQKLGPENVDLYNFASNVTRLIENYEMMLEVEKTLLRRSISFMEKLYNQEAISELKDIYSDEYGLETDRSKYDMEAEDFVAPAAQRAGGTGGGGGA